LWIATELAGAAARGSTANGVRAAARRAWRNDARSRRAIGVSAARTPAFSAVFGVICGVHALAVAALASFPAGWIAGSAGAGGTARAGGSRNASPSTGAL
jgi:hypothetical protein